MKLMKLLKEVTGKKFAPWVMLKSPKKMGMDSLTFTDFMIAVEEWLGVKISDCNIIRLYHTKLYVWRKTIMTMCG